MKGHKLVVLRCVKVCRQVLEACHDEALNGQYRDFTWWLGTLSGIILELMCRNISSNAMLARGIQLV